MTPPNPGSPRTPGPLPRTGSDLLLLVLLGAALIGTGAFVLRGRRRAGATR